LREPDQLDQTFVAHSNTHLKVDLDEKGLHGECFQDFFMGETQVPAAAFTKDTLP
jgi:hypothetical protein